MRHGSGVSSIAMNLTEVEFRGYCEGMQVVYILRAERGRNKSSCGRRLAFWMSAFNQYKHLCKAERVE